MLFSISEFSGLCDLPTQTLRYYHSMGLLSPDSVDEETGYRSYAYGQLEQVVLITTLRQAGLGVRDVRRALYDQDRVSLMLHDQVEKLARLRRREDRAIQEARQLLTLWPEVKASSYAGEVVLSAQVPHLKAEPWGGEVDDERWYDWDRVERSFHGTVQQLHEAATAQHLDDAGPAWMTSATETLQQKIDNLTPTGPHWLAKLPIAAADSVSLKRMLPVHIEVQSRPSRDELGIMLPGQLTTAKYSTALFRLLDHSAKFVEDAFIDLGPGGERVVVHDDGFEFFMGLRRADEREE